MANTKRNQRRRIWSEREESSKLDETLSTLMEDMKIETKRKSTFLAAVKENEGRKPGPRTKMMLASHHRIDNWNVLKTRLVSARMRSVAMTNTSIKVGPQEFQILKRIGSGGFSRVFEVVRVEKSISKLEITVIQAIGPDKTIRAVKMVNSVGLDGQINREELR